MKLLILNLNTVLWSIAPFLVLVGAIIGLVRRFHWSNLVSLLGAAILVLTVVIGFAVNPSMQEDLTPDGRLTFLNAYTLQMFAVTIGWCVFGLGYILSNWRQKD